MTNLGYVKDFNCVWRSPSINDLFCTDGWQVEDRWFWVMINGGVGRLLGDKFHPQTMIPETMIRPNRGGTERCACGGLAELRVASWLRGF